MVAIDPRAVAADRPNRQCDGSSNPSRAMWSSWTRTIFWLFPECVRVPPRRLLPHRSSDKEMVMRRFLLSGAVALFVLATLAPTSSALARTSLAEDASSANAQIAELYQLQTAFHSAASIHNP